MIKNNKNKFCSQDDSVNPTHILCKIYANWFSWIIDIRNSPFAIRTMQSCFVQEHIFFEYWTHPTMNCFISWNIRTKNEIKTCGFPTFQIQFLFEWKVLWIRFLYTVSFRVQSEEERMGGGDIWGGKWISRRARELYTIIWFIELFAMTTSYKLNHSRFTIRTCSVL